jgi:hypothetical protein
MTRTTNARLAGFTFLFYIAVGVTQMVLSSGTRAEGTAARLVRIAQHAPQVRITIVLSLLICVTALTLAVALYGITREENRELAVLALSFRVGEGILAAIAPLATLGLLWLATAGTEPGSPDVAAAQALGSFLLEIRGWNTTISATLFALGSTLFSWLLLRGRMIPVPLAWLGVVASVVLVVGLPLQLVEVLGGPVVQLMWIPMAAFEIPLGFWLLIKGVAAPVPRQAA